MEEFSLWRETEVENSKSGLVCAVEEQTWCLGIQLHAPHFGIWGALFYLVDTQFPHL